MLLNLNFFCVVFCRLLFVLLSFVFWPLYFLSFDFWLLFLYHQTYHTFVGRKLITITHIAFSASWAYHETMINSHSYNSNYISQAQNFNTYQKITRLNTVKNLFLYFLKIYNKRFLNLWIQTIQNKIKICKIVIYVVVPFNEKKN